MANAYRTILDWGVAINGADEATIYDGTLIKKKSLLSVMPFFPTEGLESSVKKVTARPSVSTRGFNEGVDSKKTASENVNFKVSLYQEFSNVDQQQADMYPERLGGAKAYRESEDLEFVEALSNGFMDDLFYATTASNPNDFNGLESYLGTANTTTIIDAGGSGSDCTSIYFLKLGKKGVYGLFNESSSSLPKATDRGVQNVTDSNSKTFAAYQTQFDWKVGLAVNENGIGAIRSIKSGSLPTLANMDTVIDNVKNGVDVILCNRKGLGYIKELKTSSLLKYAPGDTELSVGVMTLDGIPIVVDDAITNTETDI